MAPASSKEQQNDILTILQGNRQGCSIEKIANLLSISRTTTAKYLNMMEQAGLIESRPFGPAKVYTCTERIPIDDFVSLLPQLILILDENLVIKKVNKSLLAFFHLEKSSIIGKDIQYCPLGIYLNESRIEILKQAIEGRSQQLEEELSYEGERYFFGVRIMPILFEQGARGIVLIFEDITTLKNYQKHLSKLVEKRTAELQEVNDQLCTEILENMRVREELELSQKRYEQLVESSTDFILKFSSDATLIYSNILATEYFGLSISRQKKYGFLDTIFPDTRKNRTQMKHLLTHLQLNPSELVHFEIEYTTKENRISWISWTFRSIASLTTTANEILCIGTDITERVHAEKQIKKSEDQLQDIISHLPDPTFVLGVNRKIVIWNNAMEQMTGICSAEVVGKKRTSFTPSIFGFCRPILADLIFDPENVKIRSYFHNITDDAGILTAETFGIGRDGDECIYWVKATPLKDEEERVIAVIQSMRDITSIKRLEQVLTAKEESARGILDSLKDLIVVLNEKKEYVYVNPAFEKIIGSSITALQDHYIDEFPLPGDPVQWNQFIKAIQQTELSNRIEMHTSINDTDIYLDCYLIPFYPGLSEHMHILIDMRDISRLKGISTPLWKDETTLQEIGFRVSQILPCIKE